MRKFRFSLDAVLCVRAHKERQCMIVLAQCEQLRNDAQYTLDREHENERVARDIQREIAANASSAADLRSLRQQSVAIHSIRQHIEHAQDNLADATTHVDRARDLLSAAARERMAIEQLKERRKDAWVREEQQREMKELDEAASRLRQHSKRSESRTKNENTQQTDARTMEITR